jgi:hypothetical protein
MPRCSRRSQRGCPAHDGVRVGRIRTRTRSTASASRPRACDSEGVGSGEVAGDVDGDEEEVGVLRARGAAGVGEQRLVRRHLGREEVARTPRVAAA